MGKKAVLFEDPSRYKPDLKSRMDLDVVNMFVIAGGTLALPILAFVASFLLWPSALIRIYYWYWRRTLGMQVRYVRHEDYQFCYSFRGRPGHKPSVLMLHGFSAHKDMWLSVVKFLPKNLHLVCVDMPGHEGTTRSSLDDLSIDGQVKRIHQILQGLVDVRIPHNTFYRKLFLEIVSEKSRYSLHQNMDKIKVPTQIIWGKQDQVLDVSGADMLAKSIANSQVELLENCGHSVVMERPRKTAKLLVDFLASVHNTDSSKKLD